MMLPAQYSPIRVQNSVHGTTPPTVTAYPATRFLARTSTNLAHGGPIFLHIRYAMSGTDVAYHNAMSGTDRAYRAMRCPLMSRCAISLRPAYAMSGTSLVYAAICLRVCYAKSGTEIAYGATRMLEETW
eukprot:2867045-Rhodomonas_salina.7